LLPKVFDKSLDKFCVFWAFCLFDRGHSSILGVSICFQFLFKGNEFVLLFFGFGFLGVNFTPPPPPPSTDIEID
jgi:hypothetical protein